ncbi:MAG: hypothetical protein RIB98_14855 [Acidimicrobiales bacterium]
MSGTDPVVEVRDVLNATFGADGVITNGEFARRVEAKPSAVRSWRSRGSVPPKKVAIVADVVSDVLGPEQATRLANACQVNRSAATITRRRRAAGQRDLDLAGPAETWLSALRRVIRTDSAEEAPLVREVDGAAWFGLGSALLDGLAPGAPCVDSHGLPTYVEREFDAFLRQLLRDAVDVPTGHDRRIVAVHGPAASGRSRSVLEALRAHPVLRASPLHVLEDTPGRDVLEDYARSLVAAAGRAGRPVVTFIDDAAHVLRDAGSIRASMREISRCGAIVVVLGPSEMFAGRPLVGMHASPEDARWLASLTSIAVEPRFDEREQARAQPLFATLCSADDIETLPRALRGLSALRARIADARSAASLDHDADLRWLAVEALREIYLPTHRGPTIDEFGVLLEACRRKARPGQYSDPARIPGVIEWLTRPIGDATQTGNQWSIAIGRPASAFFERGDEPLRLRLNEILATPPSSTAVVEPSSAMTLGADYVLEMAKLRLPESVPVGQSHAGTPFLEEARFRKVGAASRLLAESADGAERLELLEEAAEAGDAEAAISISRGMGENGYLDQAQNYLHQWWERHHRWDDYSCTLAGWELLALSVERRDWDSLHSVAVRVAEDFSEPNVPALRLCTAEIHDVDDAEGFGLLDPAEQVPIFLAAVCCCDQVPTHQAQFASLWIDEQDRGELWDGAPDEAAHALGGVLRTATVRSIFEHNPDPVDALSDIRNRVDDAIATRPRP